jgi:hypothetical protein
LFARGWLVNFLVELIIFAWYYAKSSFDLETHILLWSIVQSALIFIVFYIPLWLNILILLFLGWRYSLFTATRRLEKNFRAIKHIDKYEMHFFNGVNGEPGTGKSESCVNLSLANEENNIDELEEQLHMIEMSDPSENWSIFDPTYEYYDKYLHITKYPEHYFFTSLLHEANSMVATAPLAIQDPYKDKCSVILDLDWIRPNVLADVFPFEEYKCLMIDEFDKEWNSHYTTKEVGEDGLYRFAGTAAHWFRRNGKIYAAWQIFSQVPLNIRGNMEKLVRVKERRQKYPFLLGLWLLPFRWLFMTVDDIIIRYESYKPHLAKNTRRKGLRIRKRFDFTFWYAFFRHQMEILTKILNWFDKFRYVVLMCDITDVNGNPTGQMKIPINKQDEEWNGERLYDSTFLSVGYENKHKRSEKFWDRLDVWSSIKPLAEELKKCHSRFINETVFDATGRDAEETNQKPPEYDQSEDINDFPSFDD